MSAQLPRLEARVSAIERMQAILHARIEEVSEDTTTSIKQVKDYQIQAERRLDARIEELSRDMTASFKQLAPSTKIEEVKEQSQSTSHTKAKGR